MQIIRNIQLLLIFIMSTIFCEEMHFYQGRNETLVTVDTVKTLGNFILNLENTFNPEEVYEGAVVFVKTDLLQKFFTDFHPKILQRYVLLTHESALPAPGKFFNYLQDDKIIAWLGQNPTIQEHEKFHPIPLGLAAKKWKCGNIQTLEEIQNQEIKKEYWLYLNIRVNTYPKERKKVRNFFQKQKFCYTKEKRSFKEYLIDTKKCYFTLSPRGRGLDCHRTWEAILVGSTPIVKTSTLDPLYKELPVLIVKDWTEVTQAFLEEKYLEFSEKTFCYDKLYISYWKKYIKNILVREGIIK